MKRLFYKRPSQFDINLWQIRNFGKFSWKMSCRDIQNEVRHVWLNRQQRQKVGKTDTNIPRCIIRYNKCRGRLRIERWTFCIHKNTTRDLQGAEMHIYTLPEWLVSIYIFRWYNKCVGHAVAQWLRHCDTNRKVAGSIPDGVIGIFHWHNPSGHTMALESTQPLTELSTRNISWG
jgi:hypothetical protein